ncbi:MAG TPA: LysR family transcriptional regulator [Vicinamibacterales bacterium]|jgi:DNA-binding transcriptional LysR family regulator
MDFRHIKAFIAVADALSVTKAAERLHISQPPLSRHIHQLEKELGLTLFLRHRQGVTLTEDGKRLLEKARALDAAGSDFCETARHMALGEEHRIRIGIGWGLWDVVNRLRVEFTKQRPDVTFEVRDIYCSDDLHEQLRSSQLDVVFARPPLDQTILDVAPIYHERIQAVVSDDSPFASLNEVRIRDLGETPLLLWDRHIGPALYDRVLDLYARAGVSPPMTPTPGAGPYNHAGLMLVASGKGVYLCLGVPLTSPQPASGVAVLPVADPGATIEVCVASRRGEASRLVRQFLECVWHEYPQPRRVPVSRGVTALRA